MATLRDHIKSDVVRGLDFMSPLDLAALGAAEVEAVRLDFTSGFDASMKRALNVPLTKVARRHGGQSSRVISFTETEALKTVGGAIDLTAAAAEGQQFGGE
ncbi:hypothetical protein [Pseudoduganella chitinolytica]|uniref:Uncharacterized protein n=1 Tax=Pseudoduganella chitinolytica TaxID=34070 RepID=A0ABY8BDN9_9BURK|nr:hypothetical protein [Pseudoduganella chitinolytica]WEF34022.1 hypothetical protein PX653_04405 [Pseudoduganella chitinolytica]